MPLRGHGWLLVTSFMGLDYTGSHGKHFRKTRRQILCAPWSVSNASYSTAEGHTKYRLYVYKPAKPKRKARCRTAPVSFFKQKLSAPGSAPNHFSVFTLPFPPVCYHNTQSLRATHEKQVFRTRMSRTRSSLIRTLRSTHIHTHERKHRSNKWNVCRLTAQLSKRCSLTDEQVSSTRLFTS